MKKSSVLPYAILIFALAAGFLLRLNTALSNYHLQPTEYSDASEYWQISQSIVNGGGFALNEEPTAIRTFLYPAFMACISYVSGCAHPGCIRIAQAFLGALCILMIYFLGRLVFSPIAGAVSSLFLAFNETQIRFTASLGIENFYSFLVLIVAVTLVLWSKQTSLRNTALAGFSMGLSLLCRSTLVLFPLLLGIYLFIRRGAGLKTFKTILLLAASSYVLLIPWATRNKLVFDYFYPFEAGKHISLFWEGDTLPYALETEPMVTIMSSFPMKEWNRVLLNVTFRNIVDSPATYLKSCAKRFASLWFSVDTDTVDELEFPFRFDRRFALILHFLGLFLACVAMIMHRRRMDMLVLGLLVLYFNIYLLIPVHTRFAVPLAPVLCFLSAAGLLSMIKFSYARK